MTPQDMAAQLRQEAAKLLKAADLLSPSPVAPTPTIAHKTRIGPRRLSKEVRKRFSEAQQKRRARERAEATPLRQAA